MVAMLHLADTEYLHKDSTITIVPRQNDVLFGKGTAINKHPGNLYFRYIVDSHKGLYREEDDKKQKRRIAEDVVNKFYSAIGGRFLGEVKNVSGGGNSGVVSDEIGVHPKILAKNWAVVTTEKVVLKVLHRLREKIESNDHCELSGHNEHGYDRITLGVVGSAQHSSSRICPWGGNAKGNEARCAPMSDFRLSNESYRADQPDISSAVTHKLQDWIAFYRFNLGKEDGELTDVSYLRRIYLEQVMKILQSLVEKIIGGRKCNERGNNSKHSEDQISIHPKLIVIANVIVCTPNTWVGERPCEGIFADFVGWGDSNHCDKDETWNKYLAMDALGRMAYEICMMGESPCVFKSTTPKASKTVTSLSNALSLHDGATDANNDVEVEIIDMLRKSSRTTTSEEMDGSGLISIMLDAGIPFPLCRFVSDLMDDDYGGVFRSEHSFSSFKDVLSDLKKMVDDPERFLLWSSPDRWKLDFGKKLYGRDAHMKVLMDAADQVARSPDDPMPYYGHSGLAGMRSEVIMVSGHSGSGKSQLVRVGGLCLENKGWRCLRCKFDREAHPEPLSILTHAFEEYFESFASSSTYGLQHSRDRLSPMFDLEEAYSKCLQELRARLKITIDPEGLGILADHIPSLRLVVDMALPLTTTAVNEAMMAYLLRKLLEVLSSKRTPILFFFDDLQWADPLSLALLTALVKGSGPDLLQLSSANISKQSGSEGVQQEDDKLYIMFVGSYRDNEVHENHPLAKVLYKFQSDTAINMTTISLSGFSIETLNEMLSEFLCMPVRRVRSLSELIIHKTDGQPLHVNVFIQALTADSLLTHSFTRGWEWDADSIDIFPITDSVAELYTFKLRRLPIDTLLGLQILSCFGSHTEQRVLRLVANYDGERSVDINAAIHVAISIGLVEQAAHFVRFTHDMIQKATIESICHEDLVPLLRKLIGSILNNSSSTGELGSVLFVVVDLVNRIGSDAKSSEQERVTFANLNLQAGLKAIAAPDFAGAAKYAEKGIAFLSDTCWETQYDLSLGLYETAVLSHFSNLTGDRDKLMKRMDAVFEFAKDFSDKFNTHCVWIKTLAMTDLSRAIEEGLNALERLGEPLDLSNIDYNAVRDELVKRKAQFSGERRKNFLSTNHLIDCNKVRAMKIMTSLLGYYIQTKPIHAAFVCCRMIEMSMNHGHCEDSVHAAAGFAGALVNTLGDIDEGSAWGHTTLSLMNMYNKQILIPSIHAMIYGIVFQWTEPLQSTLEPLAQGIRLSFATGNVECALSNTIFYLVRSFKCGKNIRVLTDEVEALARQHGNHFGNDASPDASVYTPLLQFVLTPLYNTLNELGGDENRSKKEEPSFPFDKVRFVNNVDILKYAMESKQNTYFKTILFQETSINFMSRNMDSALACADMYIDYFAMKTKAEELSTPPHTVFYEALITFYFMRRTGDERYQVRGENALSNMKGRLIHSDWNFKNKLLLIEAEYHNTMKDFDKAQLCYEASIKAAQEHRFIQEEAIAQELAGIFFLERGERRRSHSYFNHSLSCYQRWGAFAVVRRIGDFIQNEFGSDLMHTSVRTDDLLAPAFVSKSLTELSSKKRLFRD